MRIVASARGSRSLRRGLLRAAAAGVLACTSAAAQPAARPAPPAEAARPGEAGAPAWQRPERWARLRVGMSQLEVLRLLGEPGKITHYYAFERWEYPDALGQRVNFDERGRLMVWGPLAR